MHESESGERVVRMLARDGKWREIVELLNMSILDDPVGKQFMIYAHGHVSDGCLWVGGFVEPTRLAGRVGDGPTRDMSPDDAVDVIKYLHHVRRNVGSKL